jgi:hypothetical protein
MNDATGPFGDDGCLDMLLIGAGLKVQCGLCSDGAPMNPLFEDEMIRPLEVLDQLILDFGFPEVNLLLVSGRLVCS